jgi:transposase
MDLRERIVSAHENGEGSHATLAQRFAVSKALVGKLVRQKSQLGTLEPQVHLRGRKPAIQGKKLEELREHVAQHPDATLAERIAALGVDCCVNTMWKTLRRMGFRFKKNFACGRARSS